MENNLIQISMPKYRFGGNLQTGIDKEIFDKYNTTAYLKKENESVNIDMNEFVLNYQSLEIKVKKLEEIVDLLNYAPPGRGGPAYEESLRCALNLNNS